MGSVVAELLQPSATTGSYRLDRACVIEELDEEAARLLGRPAEQLRGRNLWDAFPALRGGLLQRRYAEVLAGAGEQRFVFRHRATERWFAVSATPLGPLPRPSGIGVRFADATEEFGGVRAEIARERLDAAALALGRLAHDMNNCLTVTLGNAEYLEDELPDRPELVAAVRLILQAAERGAGLTGRVLRFARRHRPHPAEVELPRLLAALAARLEGETPAWRLALDCDPDLPPVLAEAAELEAALEELVANARAAMPGGGVIGISTRPVPGVDLVAIAVEDRGPGMAQSLLLRCAEPFVSGAGLPGLGLSAVHSFAEAAGGALRLENRAGGGLRAVLEVPLAHALARRERRRAAETVLLVEDDPAGRAGLVRLLGTLGHQVAAAASADEALRLLREGLAPAAILADVVLPGGLDGARLVEEARRLLPGLPALLMSGYAARLPGAEPAVQGGVPLLAKPFRRAELAEALGGVLRVGRDAHPGATAGEAPLRPVTVG